MSGFARARRAAVFVALSVLVAGCGGKLVKVTGQVVENGTPVQLAEGQSVQIDFSTADGTYPPLSLGVYAGRDGRFAADMNDGTGRGLPPGKYKVRLNGEGTSVGKKVNPKLFKDVLTLDVGEGTPAYLTVDLAAGTVTQK